MFCVLSPCISHSYSSCITINANFLFVCLNTDALACTCSGGDSVVILCSYGAHTFKTVGISCRVLYPAFQLK